MHRRQRQAEVGTIRMTRMIGSSTYMAVMELDVMSKVFGDAIWVTQILMILDIMAQLCHFKNIRVIG